MKTFEIGSLSPRLVTSRAGVVTIALWTGALDDDDLQRIDDYLGRGDPQGGLLLVTSGDASLSAGAQRALIAALEANAPAHCAVVVENKGSIARRALSSVLHGASIRSRHPLNICPTVSAAVVWLSVKLRGRMGSQAHVVEALNEMRLMAERVAYKRAA